MGRDKRCQAITGKGTQCQNPAAPDALVCGVHLGRKRGRGRPSKLTGDLTDEIVAILRKGAYVETAVAAVGISQATYYDWLKRGDPASRAKATKQYREFRERVERARAEGETHNVEMVAKAALKDWRAAAWMLERQFPRRWGGPQARDRAGGYDDPDSDADADVTPERSQLWVNDMVGPDGKAL